jgi:hypothetical protein
MEAKSKSTLIIVDGGEGDMYVNGDLFTEARYTIKGNTLTFVGRYQKEIKPWFEKEIDPDEIVPSDHVELKKATRKKFNWNWRKLFFETEEYYYIPEFARVRKFPSGYVTTIKTNLWRVNTRKLA